METLKNKLFKMLFKYEAYVLEKNESEINDLWNKNYDLEKVNKEYSRLHEKLLDTFNKYDFILGIEKNKNEESYIAACNSDDAQIDIYLIHIFYKQKPFIQSILHTNYSTGDTYLEITDVQAMDNSVGNGSLLMNHFLKEAKRRNVKYIYGMLSEVDKDNFIRSVPYYKKFGFDVKLNEEKTSGKIKIIL